MNDDHAPGEAPTAKQSSSSTPAKAAGPQPPAQTGKSVEISPSVKILGGVLGIALLSSIRDQQETQKEVDALLASWTPPKPLPPLEPLPAVSSPPRPWGVTERPERITWDFCFRLKWRTWPVDQKRIVPSASSRSQYLRVGGLPELWGKKLDELGTTFHVMRWIAAPDDFFECQKRYMRVIAGEDLGDLRRAEAPTPREPIPEETIRIYEEELTRIAGREIRVPRESLEPRVCEDPPPTGQARKKRGRPPGRRRR